MAATGFHTADELNALLPGTLPGLLGIVIDTHEPGRLTSHLDVRPDKLQPDAVTGFQVNAAGRVDPF